MVILGCLLLVITPAAAANLNVAWEPNGEADLAGYFVYYGTKARPQSHRLEVGLQTQYRIQDLTPGETYSIAVTAVDTAGNESVISAPVVVQILTGQEKPGALPRQHHLLQNHPNPFHIETNQATTIIFELIETSPVKLEIFNILGQRVIALLNKTLDPGAQKILWNGRDAKNRPVRAGVYLYRLQTSRLISTRRLVVYH
jgi:hypothetical protein